MQISAWIVSETPGNIGETWHDSRTITAVSGGGDDVDERLLHRRKPFGVGREMARPGSARDKATRASDEPTMRLRQRCPPSYFGEPGNDSTSSTKPPGAQ